MNTEHVQSHWKKFSTGRDQISARMVFVVGRSMECNTVRVSEMTPTFFVKSNRFSSLLAILFELQRLRSAE
jgi:hypothetical protein